MVRAIVIVCRLALRWLARLGRGGERVPVKRGSGFQLVARESYHSVMETPSPVSRAQPLFHRRGWRVGFAAMTVLVIGASVVTLGAVAGWFGSDEVTVNPVPTAAIRLTSHEAAFYEYVAPRLHEMGAQARELARLGEARSRNIFDLQAHAGRLAELSKEIDAYVAAKGTPPLFAAAHETYLDGLRIANRAIDEAERSILAADWERLGRVVAIFTAGADDLEAAANVLDAAGGARAFGTPT